MKLTVDYSNRSVLKRRRITFLHSVRGNDAKRFIAAYEQSLSMVYDLEFKAGYMVFVCTTPSCHNNHLCHIIYKFPI